MQDLNAIREAVIGGLHREIEARIGEATAAGVPPAAVMNDGLIAAMDEIGRRFGAGEIFVPEMLVAALTMKKGLDILKPLLAAGGAAPAGTILMATVKGDLHDIGKNIVAMMLEGAGFRVVDLGVDVDAEKVIRGIEAENPDILGFSSLLTTTMPEMGAIIAALVAGGSATGCGSWWVGRHWTPPTPRGSAPMAMAGMPWPPWRWRDGSWR